MIITFNTNCIKQAELALVFQMTERTIQRWHYYGLPRHGEGPGCYYVWAEVLPWYVSFRRSCDTDGTGNGDNTGEGGDNIKFRESPTHGPNYFKALALIQEAQKALTGGVKEELPPRRRARKRHKRAPKPKPSRANLS